MKTLILYDENNKSEAINKSILQRDRGIPTVSMRKSENQELNEYEEYCRRNNFDTLIYFTGEEVIRKEF